MFLKSIEIRGFKSFADKVELFFKHGITAVVGPNGSGKSNISDAVRWVLGEQSIKSLRGGKMEDVIFAGTLFRKPVGLAQVSLILDNCDNKLNIDYSEVIISRKLYRSGESEYYINNTQCRLKDIQELFMDTGIGKEGYSIIGQGKIDAILSGKPEERRNLLEEAAGIVKFKVRKDEAEKKLYNTEQNLLRINDIIGTYEERLEPLRTESEKAKAFLKYSEELKQKEVNIIVDSIEKLEVKIKTTLNSFSEVEKHIENLNKEKSEIKNDIDLINEEINKNDTAHEELKNRYYDSKTSCQNLQGENNLLSEKIDNFKIILHKNEEELNKMNQKYRDSNIQITEMKEKLCDYKIEQSQTDEKILEHEKEIFSINDLISKNEEALKNLKNDEFEILTQISNMKNKKIILKSELDSMQRKLENTEASLQSYENSTRINLNTKDMLINEIEKLNVKIKEYEEKTQKRRKEINSFNSELIEEERNLKSLNADYHKFETSKNMLINLEKNYEGYNKSVKILMNDIKNGKIGSDTDNSFVLGEIIEVKKEYETAIEVSLGGAISDVITKDETTAKKLIEYLKRNNIGRATFLPLNIINGKSISVNENVKKAKGYLGIGSELVSFDEMFANAVNHVLGRIMIAEDMDCALNIARLMNYSCRIVTLSGETVNPGGSLTGGSLYHKSVSVISRKREIEECSENLIKCTENINNLTKKIEARKSDIKRFNDEVLNLKDEIHFFKIEITKFEEKLNSLNSENEKMEKNILILNNELTVINAKSKTSNEDILKVDKTIMDSVQKEEENNNKITLLEDELETKGESYENLKNTLMELKIRKAQIDEMVNGRVKEFNRLSDEIKEMNFSINQLKKEIVVSQDNIEIFEETIKEKKVKIEETERYIEETEDVIRQYEIEKLKLKEKINAHNSRLEEKTALISKKDDEKHKFDLINTKLETEKETIYSKLNDEYELTLAEAVLYKSDDFIAVEYKKRIDELKSSISSLGTVNVGAVEEYQSLKEKYTFLAIQKEDLFNAKNELENVIEEMTNKMKILFNENFQKLRANFNETFKELFKGGSADLILAEGNELTSNIEINVQPPGKKLQNINLMSGGEKGLSAIALLFAILKMKPTPFCILDEIEASLDDANVHRYAEFLKKFSTNIQFIIITHRKGTMEASDVLYGVTMEEKGVSKVISVDLEVS